MNFYWKNIILILFYYFREPHESRHRESLALISVSLVLRSLLHIDESICYVGPTCVYNNLIILHNLTVNLLRHICIDCEIHCLDFRQLFASQGAKSPNKQTELGLTDRQTHGGTDRQGCGERRRRGALRFIWFDYLANISIQKLMYLTAA